MTLTADEVAMFHAIFTCAERVDWACYESFRLRILAKGAEPTAAHLGADMPALNDEGSPLSSASSSGPRSFCLEPFGPGANPDYEVVRRYSADFGEAPEELRTR